MLDSDHSADIKVTTSCVHLIKHYNNALDKDWIKLEFKMIY